MKKVDKARLKDSQGRPLTQSLFLDEEFAGNVVRLLGER